METDLVGRWLTIDGDSGIVRYVGPVAGTKGNWLGVEWATSGRGKHNGTKDNHQYFVCKRQQNNGSFIRNIQRINWGQTLFSAAQQRYITDSNEIKCYPKTIDGNRRGKIEAVGFDKIAQFQADPSRLEILGLDMLQIYGTAPHELSAFMNLHTLSLAGNFLTQWQSIEDILNQLPSSYLSTLDISANPWDMPLDIPTNPSSKFKVCWLKINNSPSLTWTDACHMALRLGLRSLSFGWSQLVTTNTTITATLSLEELRLEHNQLTQLPFLDCLPQLKHLDVSNNPIKQVTAVALQSTKNSHLELLNISGTQIDSWTSINNLLEFSQLHTLSISHTPLTMPDASLQTSSPTTDTIRAQTIGRLSQITKLDGSMITAAERTEMERYYLALCARSVPADTTEDALSKQFPRFRELVQVHGLPSSIGQRSDPLSLRSRLAATAIELVCDLDDPEPLAVLHRPLIHTMLVRQLRPVAMRLAKSRSFELFLRPAGTTHWSHLDSDSRPLSFYGLDDQSVVRVVRGSQ
ncbi:RNI-like protein [Coemansia reversa NRRL 1564]|uniref:RNI-like protein n=1 Tax=Coemansia reversa (strain ATCC 12441 / NRRL 1564) TaxID=763665 RepID=A0A2G5B9T0_COERN|nr:RNI-like protein [Coemansia reversa NRRL 1564]|eukprot:PIA15487.1 RNI-like protein [Coemansia reversa NRRL 1564]